MWKVLYTYSPRAPDEIELIDGDFVYLDEGELEGSPDGWFKGTSWLTGCTGMLPGSYAERTSESETWTLHRSANLFVDDGEFLQNFCIGKYDKDLS